MYCPEHLIFKSTSKNLWFWFYDSADIRWELIPVKRKYNPLRYEIVFHAKNGRRITINEGGMWARKFSNAIYRIRKTLRLSA